MIPSLTDFIPVLKIAVGPVILISGIGLLLLSMTNRLGRAIDRAHVLSAGTGEGNPEIEKRTLAQLKVLYRRADIIRLSIIFSSFSLLLAACLIISLFISALFHLAAGWFLVLLFIGCLLALIISLILFILDINQALAALKLEVEDHLK